MPAFSRRHDVTFDVLLLTLLHAVIDLHLNTVGIVFKYLKVHRTSNSTGKRMPLNECHYYAKTHPSGQFKDVTSFWNRKLWLWPKHKKSLHCVAGYQPQSCRYFVCIYIQERSLRSILPCFFCFLRYNNRAVAEKNALFSVIYVSYYTNIFGILWPCEFYSIAVT